ncbi:MAG: hypothetical protein CMJ78_09910 [Planctomycetaceae bacterium]|nr:hypothetical protein [Planctomycetaceae bacterium]
MDSSQNLHQQRAHLERVATIPVPVSAKIATKKIAIADLLPLQPGAIIELDQSSSEPLDILVGDRKFAVGHPVKIQDRLGVVVHHVERRSSDG